MAGTLRSVLQGIVLAGSLLLFPTITSASCYIIGHVVGEPNTAMPQYGAWKYTLNVSWDTGTRYALSHFNMLIDEAGHSCTCSMIDMALHWPDPIGTAGGCPNDCTVPFRGYLECYGDPSIEHPGIVLKFEPDPEVGCEPSRVGTGVFVFYSDYAPGRIAAENMFLTDKAGQLSCSGQLTGWFPALPCDPTPVEDHSWGNVKGLYGD